MINGLTYALFFILPYASLTILVVGVLYRIALWLRSSKGPMGLYLGLSRLVLQPGQRSFLGAAANILARMFTYYTLIKVSYRRDYPTWLGVALFHWGILLLIIFHLHLWLPQLAVPESTMYIMGVTVGAISLASGLYLLLRRIRIQSLFRVHVNYLDDYVAVTWVLLILALGMALRITAPAQLFNQVSQWALGLTRLHYIPLPSDPLLYVHILAVELFMIYVPFAKMMHPFSMPVNPALYGRFDDIRDVERRVEETLGW